MSTSRLPVLLSPSLRLTMKKNLANKETKTRNIQKEVEQMSSLIQKKMDLFVQKKQRENMRDELRKMISETLGPSAWQELIRMENEIRQKQKDAMYKRIERKETIIAWAAGLFLFLICVGALFGFVWIAVRR